MDGGGNSSEGGVGGGGGSGSTSGVGAGDVSGGVDVSELVGVDAPVSVGAGCASTSGGVDCDITGPKPADGSMAT